MYAGHQLIYPWTCIDRSIISKVVYLGNVWWQYYIYPAGILDICTYVPSSDNIETN